MAAGFSSGAWAAIAVLGAALVGALGALVGTAWSTRSASRLWRYERKERRRDERRAAYEALLLSVQVAAHRLGNLGDEDYGPPAVDRQEAAYFFDTEVTPKVRAIQLIVPAGGEVVAAALELRAALAAFRDGMTRRPHAPVPAT